MVLYHQWTGLLVRNLPEDGLRAHYTRPTARLTASINQLTALGAYTGHVAELGDRAGLAPLGLRADVMVLGRVALQGGLSLIPIMSGPLHSKLARVLHVTVHPRVVLIFISLTVIFLLIVILKFVKFVLIESKLFDFGSRILETVCGNFVLFGIFFNRPVVYVIDPRIVAAWAAGRGAVRHEGTCVHCGGSRATGGTGRIEGTGRRGSLFPLRGVCGVCYVRGMRGLPAAAPSGCNLGVGRVRFTAE